MSSTASQDRAIRARDRAQAATRVAVGIAVCALAGGCGSGNTMSKPHAAAGQTSASTPTRLATLAPGPQTAPKAFAAGQGVQLPSSGETNDQTAPIALAGDTALINAGTGLKMLDTKTDRILASAAAPANVFNGPAPPTVPMIYNSPSGPAALVGYVVHTVPHGTTPATVQVQIEAIDSAGRQRTAASTMLASDATSMAAGPGNENPSVTIIGHSGPNVIAVVGSPGDLDGWATEAIDLAHNKLLWLNHRFLAAAVVDGTVIGNVDPAGAVGRFGANTGTTTSDQLEGITIQTGTTSWRQQNELPSPAAVQAAGSSSAVAEETISPIGGGTEISLVNARTGSVRVLERLGVGAGDSWSCRSDEQSTIICSTAAQDSAAVIALDESSGTELWRLPQKSENRIAPRVTAVWHGFLYGTTASGTRVVLSTRTGRDVNDTPGAAPVLVDGTVGIAATGDTFTAYRATR